VKRTKFDRLWTERVQFERMAQGREKALRKRETALARQALQDRYEPCPSMVQRADRTRTHHWLVDRAKRDYEQCIFCNLMRPYLRPKQVVTELIDPFSIPAPFDWAEAKAIAANSEIVTAAVTKIPTPPPTKGAKG
jgi:hypothetical protein